MQRQVSVVLLARCGAVKRRVHQKDTLYFTPQDTRVRRLGYMTSWSARNWKTYQTQRLSVALHLAAAGEVARELGRVGSGEGRGPGRSTGRVSGSDM